MTQLETKPQLNAWVPTAWDNYLTQLDNPDYHPAKGYYHLGCMRLEMLPVGFDHSTDHSLLSLAINLFGMVNGLPLIIADSCTFRKTDDRDCQPDLAVYAGDNVTTVPKQNLRSNLNWFLAHARISAAKLQIVIAIISLLGCPKQK